MTTKGRVADIRNKFLARLQPVTSSSTSSGVANNGASEQAAITQTRPQRNHSQRQDKISRDVTTPEVIERHSTVSSSSREWKAKLGRLSSPWQHTNDSSVTSSPRTSRQQAGIPPVLSGRNGLVRDKQNGNLRTAMLPSQGMTSMMVSDRLQD